MLNQDKEESEQTTKVKSLARTPFIRVKPKQGTMILFPATWNWLHKAYPVQGDNPKYIVGTLLHYV